MNIIIVATSVCLLLTARAWAFHGEGSGNCKGCHVLHNSEDNTKSDAGNPSGNPYMLREATPSDVCLSCHATEQGAVLAKSELNPSPEKGAGNFIYLLEDNLNDGAGGADTANWIPGDAAGHNLNAPSYSLFPDLSLTTAPGGSFDASWLGCTSCHDPHGNDNFRMLYGAGPIQDGLYTFSNAAPEATGISLRYGAESNSNHTAYKRGMSEWCANCHAAFHNTSYPTVLVHPSGAALGASIADAYNAYNGTLDPSGGSEATAYLAQVPFEDADSLNSTLSTHGPSSSSRVMCLTCHRAHASSAPDAGRWDFNVTYLGDDGQQSGSYPIPNPYSVSQRTLCSKCHAREINSSIVEVGP